MRQRRPDRLLEQRVLGLERQVVPVVVRCRRRATDEMPAFGAEPEAGRVDDERTALDPLGAVEHEDRAPPGATGSSMPTMPATEAAQGPAALTSASQARRVRRPSTTSVARPPGARPRQLPRRRTERPAPWPCAEALASAHSRRTIPPRPGRATRRPAPRGSARETAPPGAPGSSIATSAPAERWTSWLASSVACPPRSRGRDSRARPGRSRRLPLHREMVGEMPRKSMPNLPISILTVVPYCWRIELADNADEACRSPGRAR